MPSPRSVPRAKLVHTIADKEAMGELAYTGGEGAASEPTPKQPRPRKRPATCEHGRRKTLCTDCGGGSICQHNRVRGRCRECGGGSICKHKRVRRSCRECGGGSICEHQRQRTKCIYYSIWLGFSFRIDRICQFEMISIGGVPVSKRHFGVAGP